MSLTSALEWFFHTRDTFPWDDTAEDVARRRIPSVTTLVGIWAQMLELGHWRLWHPGELFDPRDGTEPYPLNITGPQWGTPAIPVEERDPDLDLEWLLGVALTPPPPTLTRDATGEDTP